jgi:hypothetical protein
MTTTSNLLRTIVTYSVVLPVALLLGYLIAQPLDFSGLATMGLIGAVLCSPLLLRYHHALLFLSWNMMAALNFLPGRPEFWLAMAVLSLTISVVQRTLIRHMRFIHAPSVLTPLLVLMAVVAVTAHFTGGIGLKALGSSSVGGKNYLYMLGAAIGVLAMMSRRIPLHKASLFLGLFFLGGSVNSIGSVVVRFCPPLLPLLYFFPNTDTINGSGITRLAGIGMGCKAVWAYLLARHGMSGLLKGKKFSALILFGLAILGDVGSGGRTGLIVVGLTLLILFFIEGLHRSRYAPVFLAVGVLVSLALVAFSDRFPLPIQRSLAVLPLKLDPRAITEAEGSSSWRIELWKVASMDIPKYFWLGKGLEVSRLDLETSSDLSDHGYKFATTDSFILSGNFHNGPLSVIINFGIWGVIAWLWFVFASIGTLNRNRLYGEESLKVANNFIFALFVARIIVFFAVFGDLRIELAFFAGLVGFSLALNGGVARRVQNAAAAQPISIKPRRPLPLSPPFSRPELHPQRGPQA